MPELRYRRWTAEGAVTLTGSHQKEEAGHRKGSSGLLLLYFLNLRSAFSVQ